MKNPKVVAGNLGAALGFFLSSGASSQGRDESRDIQRRSIALDLACGLKISSATDFSHDNRANTGGAPTPATWHLDQN